MTDSEQEIEDAAELVGDIAVALLEFGWTITRNWPTGTSGRIDVIKANTKETWKVLAKRVLEFDD